MNNRFRFRVFDKEKNNYVDDSEVELILHNDGVLLFGNWHEDIKVVEQDKFIVEQCTGMKDKNGNLIYEGDILQHSCSGKGVVRFGNYTGCFAVGWENFYQDLTGWYLDDYYEPDDCGRLRINLDNTHSPITEEDAGDFEIISNVHEQSEQKE